MGGRIAGLIVLLVLLGGGAYSYQHYRQEKAQAAGEVHCIGCDTPEEHARYVKESQGDLPVAPAGGSATGASSAGTSAAGGDAPAAGSNAVGAANGLDVVNAASTAGAGNAGPVSGAEASRTALAVGSAAPAADTIQPNAPNGMVFTGKGTYQWYRQGNLTWRVDTTSGRSCIVYATMEEWRKQIVLSHGCGRDA